MSKNIESDIRELCDLNDIQVDLIRDYILDNFCPKESDGMIAIYVPIGSSVIPPEKVGALIRLEAAVRKFIYRVDKGEIKSKRTYVEFKTLVDELDLANILSK